MHEIVKAAKEALPGKHQAKLYFFIALGVILAGSTSAFLSHKFKFARRLTYSTRECTALARLASVVINKLRENPERRIKCPTKDGDSSALFRSLVPAPAAMVAGYYSIILEFRDFLEKLLSSKCKDGHMTYKDLADFIENAILEKCSNVL
jgi:hypothetical protein